MGSYGWRSLQREGVRYDRALDAGAVERHLGGVSTTWEERLRAAAPAQDLERARLVVRAAMAAGPAA